MFDRVKNIQINMLLFLASFFSALTIIIIKQYEKSSNIWLLLAVALSEIGLIYSYIQLLKSDNIITLFGLVKIIAILMVIVPGIIFFESKLTIKQIIGLIFAVIAIYLLN